MTAARVSPSRTPPTIGPLYVRAFEDVGIFPEEFEDAIGDEEQEFGEDLFRMTI